MEGFEVSIRINPSRFLASVNDERSCHNNDGTDNQYGEPDCIATRRNLTGRDKAQDECQQRTTETESADEPHQSITTLTDTERTVQLLHLVTQYDSSCKHQHKHDKVKNYCQL